MKKFVKIISLAAAAAMLFGCTEFGKDCAAVQLHDDNAVEHYVLNKALEIDPFNPTGVDISPYFSEFSSIKLNIYYEGGKIAAAEFEHGALPYNPLTCALPQGKVSCSYDASVYPAVLRLESGDVLCQMVYNEPVFNFSLDYNKISYKYTFKAVK